MRFTLGLIGALLAALQAVQRPQFRASTSVVSVDVSVQFETCPLPT